MIETRPLTKSELGELALDAAIEIDLEHNSKTPSFIQTKKFLNQIRKDFSSRNQSVLLRDEAMFPIYSFAFERAADSLYQDRESFLVSMQQMMNKHQIDLENFSNLNDMKKFCLAFHEAIVSGQIGKTKVQQKNDGRIR